MKRLYLSTAKSFTAIFLSTILPFSILNLPPISALQDESYTRCGDLFNCGILTGIGYPFWGGGRPEECGYPRLQLVCENATTTKIQMNGVEYRVLDLNQETQILRITRDDLSQSFCQQEFTNSSLDYTLFDFSSGYVNLTFLYGCPALDFPVPNQFDCPVTGIAERNGYVEFGTMQIPGMCHVSVVVPVSYASLANFSDVKEVVAQGFEVRFKVAEGRASCSECRSSGGRCGYDVAGKQFVCLCSNESTAESRTCAAAAVVAAGNYSPRAPTEMVAPATSKSEFYQTCGNTYSCGNTIARIGYPFRGSQDPPYCGHPSLVLTCEDRNNATTINIMNSKYRVLEIQQTAQTMRIVREDIMEGTCPQEMANATLDYSLFDFAAAYTNFTFLFGCPQSNFPGLSLISCGNSEYNGVYVFAGTQGPGNCNSSVVVPAIVTGDGGRGPTTRTGLEEILQRGFVIRWKISSKDCSDCIESNGRCGFNFEANRTACFCRDPPYVSKTCSMASGGSPANTSQPGKYSSSSYLCKLVC